MSWIGTMLIQGHHCCLCIMLGSSQVCFSKGIQSMQLHHLIGGSTDHISFSSKIFLTQSEQPTFIWDWDECCHLKYRLHLTEAHSSRDNFFFIVALPEECPDFFEIRREPSDESSNEAGEGQVVVVGDLDSCRVDDLKNGLVVLVNHLLVIGRRLNWRTTFILTSELKCSINNMCIQKLRSSNLFQNFLHLCFLNRLKSFEATSANKLLNVALAWVLTHLVSTLSESTFFQDSNPCLQHLELPPVSLRLIVCSTWPSHLLAQQ